MLTISSLGSLKKLQKITAWYIRNENAEKWF